MRGMMLVVAAGCAGQLGTGDRSPAPAPYAAPAQESEAAPASGGETQRTWSGPPPTISQMPVDVATNRAREIGFTGAIDVVESDDANCLPTYVCDVAPAEWYLNGVPRMQLTVGRAR